MVIFNKKRLQIILITIILGVLTFTIQEQTSKKIETIETMSTPVSGKTIILDAGHGKPDRTGQKVKMEQQKQI